MPKPVLKGRRHHNGQNNSPSRSRCCLTGDTALRPSARQWMCAGLHVLLRNSRITNPLENGTINVAIASLIIKDVERNIDQPIFTPAPLSVLISGCPSDHEVSGLTATPFVHVVSWTQFSDQLSHLIRYGGQNNFLPVRLSSS
jgi:hypothetical protein